MGDPDAFASGNEPLQINDPQNRNASFLTAVELRLGDGATEEGRTGQKLCLRVYAKATGSEPAGPFFTHTRVSPLKQHTVSPALHRQGHWGQVYADCLAWLLQSFVSQAHRLIFTYRALPRVLMTVCIKKSLLSLIEKVTDEAGWGN